MQVYKSVDYGQFNSEGLYKLKRLGIYLDSYNEENDLSFESLVELSKSSEFKEFLNNYQSMRIDSLHALGYTSTIDGDFSDFDLLMGFTFDGGSLYSFVNDSPSSRFDSHGLVQHLLSTSPQAFILNSGLRPTELSAHMYVSLLRDVIETFPMVITEVIETSQPAERCRLYLSLVSLSKAAGIQNVDISPVFKTPSNRAVGRLTGTSMQSATVGDYLSDLERHSNFTLGTEALGYNLSVFFLANAFHKCIEIKDTQQLVKELEGYATAWALHLKCPRQYHDDFVKQLLTSAFVTFPGHFENADFSNKNLMGLHVNAELIGLNKTVCDGPLAMLIKPQTSQNTILNALEFIHELSPDFSLSDLYEQSDFKHSQSVSILRAIGGHCPGAELSVTQNPLEPEKAVSLLSVLRATDSYKKYRPQALDTLMSYYITRLPKRNRAGTVQPMQYLEFSKDMQARVRQEFTRAYATNTEFKRLFIHRIERTPGITSDHLRMFDLSHDDVPRTMAKMHRNERGTQLEAELGL